MLEAPFVFVPKLSREKRLLRRVVFFPPQEARYAARRSLRHELLDTLHGLDGGVGVAKGGQAHVAFARGAEARARRGDDARTGEQRVEKLPAPYPFRRLAPDVRAVHSAVHGEPGGFEALFDHACVVAVVRKRLLDLALAFLGVDGRGAALDDVACAVELVHWRRFHMAFRLWPSRSSSLGTTVYPQRAPVNPAVFENERNSMAQVLAPSTS